MANFQYLVTCMAFSIAKPFREPVYSNKPFFVFIVCLFVFNVLLIYLPADSAIAAHFDLEPVEEPDIHASYLSYK